MEMLPAVRSPRLLLVPEVVPPEDERPVRVDRVRSRGDYVPPRPADPVGLLLDLYV